MYRMEDFTDNLKEFAVLLDELTGIENRKFEAALKNDIFQIESCMKMEQAYVLKFRGLDKKREQIQTDLKLKDMTLSQILALAGGQEKEALLVRTEDLNEKTAAYRSAYTNAKNVIEINLHNIEKTLADLKSKSADKNISIYSPDGRKDGPGTVFTNTKA